MGDGAQVVENRVFVSNVPASATADDVRAHFSQFGSLSDVYMPRVFGTHNHKGIAYVTFDDKEAQDMVFEYEPHVLAGQQVSVQFCLPKGQGKGEKGAQAANNAGDRIFITSIPQDVTQEEIQTYFQGYGTWSDIYMPKGNFAAGHKGICFISFTSPASVAQVMASGPHLIRGAPIVVDIAAPREKGKGKGFAGGCGFAGGGGFNGGGCGGFNGGGGCGGFGGCGGGLQMSLGAGGSPMVSGGAALIAAAAASAGQPAVQQYVMPAHGGSQGGRFGCLGMQQAPVAQPTIVPGRLFLTKMSPAIDKDDLIMYFQQYGELNDVYIPPGGKMIAFVGFDDPNASEMVAQQPQHEVKEGCFVNVTQAVDRPGKGGGKARFNPY